MCDFSETGFENKMKIENLKKNENRKPEKKIMIENLEKNDAQSAVILTSCTSGLPAYSNK